MSLLISRILFTLIVLTVAYFCLQKVWTKRVDVLGLLRKLSESIPVAQEPASTTPASSRMVGAIRGEVHLNDSNDATGIEVVASPGNRKTSSDRRGKYSFEVLPEGYFTLAFSKEGYHTQEQKNVSATADGSFEPTLVILQRNTTYGWQEVKGLPSPSSNTLSLIATPAGDLFVGTGAEGSVHRSSDVGSSWTQVLKLQKDEYVRSLLSVPPSGVVAAIVRNQFRPGECSAFWTSEDAGNEWYNYEIPSPAGEIAMMLADHAQNIFAAVTTVKRKPHVIPAFEILWSMDHGHSWQAIHDFNDTDMVWPLYCARKGELYVAVFRADSLESTGACKLMKASNDGKKWEECAGFPIKSVYGIRGLTQDDRDRLICVATGPDDSRAGYNQMVIYRSENPLEGWDVICKLKGDVSAALNPLVSSPHSKKLYLGFEQELLRSEDGGITWQREFKDEKGGTPNCLVQTPAGKLSLMIYRQFADGKSENSLWISEAGK